jgi:hypothetical protein
LQLGNRDIRYKLHFRLAISILSRAGCVRLTGQKITSLSRYVSLGNCVGYGSLAVESSSRIGPVHCANQVKKAAENLPGFA